MRLSYLLLPLLTAAATSTDSLAQSPNAKTFQPMQSAVDNGTYPNIHSILISHHNQLIYEHYWPEKDEILGDDLGIRPHGPDSLQTSPSVTS